MPFTSATDREEFSAGYGPTGARAPSEDITITLGGIFTVSGAVKFVRQPNGRIDVTLPSASVGIKIPDGSGGLTQVFALQGAAAAPTSAVAPTVASSAAARPGKLG